MSDGTAARGVIVGHGEMANGLITAVRRIAGDHADALVAVSNEGKSPDVLRAEIDELTGESPAVVFVDICSGSCWMAALKSCRDRPRHVVVSGVNLPMLLDFVFQRERPIEELATRLVERGRAAITEPLFPR